MFFVRVFFVNELIWGLFFGSCCLLVFFEIWIVVLVFVKVLLFVEGCDVSVILGDCDWLIVL